MSFTKNKYKTKCRRCGKDLEPGIGFLVPRRKGYEIICSSDCTIRHKPNKTIIEIRVPVPQVTGVCKQEPYIQKAEIKLLYKLKELFPRDWRARTRSNNYRTTRGGDIDNNGSDYVYVRAVMNNVKEKNKMNLIIYA